jgi:hypothetical protein
LTAEAARSDLDYYTGRLEPPYDSPRQASIGHMLDQYGIPFFYRHPALICQHGRRTIWRPDFTLPTYNSLVIEYDSGRHRAFDVTGRRTRSDIYRLNGIAALFLEPSDLAKPDWQQRLYDQLEQCYHQPLAYLRDRPLSRQR